MSELSDFVLTYCRLAGGLVERPAYGVYEVLWPEPVADQFGVPAYQRLAFDEEEEQESDDGITHLSYGHPLVEEIAEVTAVTPSNALLHINAVRLEKPGLGDLARQALTLANARLTPAPGQIEARALHHYIRFTFKAALVTDEKQEQLVSVLMDAQNGYAVPKLDHLEHQAILETENAFKNLSIAPPRWLPSESQPLSRPVLERLLERAAHAARDALAEPIAHLTHRATRFLELDRARLEQYYADMEHNLEQRRDRSSDEGRRASLQDKLQATRAERQAKLVDVEAKYRLRIELELLNLLVITLPKLTLPVEIKHRATQVTRTVVWNPLLHQIEPLPCDVCGRPATRLTLCNGGHLVHTDGACLLADEEQCVDCKRLFCRHCAHQLGACAVCGRPVCRHSMNHCDDCGRGTCREHVGLCHAADGAPVKLEPEPLPVPTAPVEPAPQPAAKPKEPETEKQSRGSAAQRPAEKETTRKSQPRAIQRRFVPPRGPKAVKIEVYVDPATPVVDAYVLTSGNKEIAVRTWKRVDEGIAVWCRCEKSWMCRVDQTLLDAAPADEIDRQLWGEIGALRQEYDVSPRKLSVYNIIRGTPRPTSRLVLRGPWKE
jgi:hypothetical protein